MAGIDAIGGYVKQYQVQPNPMKLVSYGLTFSDVISALENNNIGAGAGYVRRKASGTSCVSRGGLKTSGRLPRSSWGPATVHPSMSTTWQRFGSVASSAPGRPVKTARK